MVEDAVSLLRRCFRAEGLAPPVLSLFQQIIYDYYRAEGRSFPWRETGDPYRILVSEIMLQQTQTSRVVDKYLQFITAFPDFTALAGASLRDVLAAWQGLGYNRRAVALQKTAQLVISEYCGKLPDTAEELRKLPGIGPNTAGAVLAIAFSHPAVFIETNIRSVYHYFFFPDAADVPENDLKKLVASTLDTEHPRDWYYALYDYGAMLKRTGKATDRPRDRQSRFEGSDRQVRGRIIRLLVSGTSATREQLIEHLSEPADRVDRILADLEREGFIVRTGGTCRLRE